ncbi:potassium channel family protein [Helicobacter anatolicus]|uniref:potassium channel family protein n=1 Tax=Helicobacter anatolicus TaxID=2905874 RepID=UPI001E3FD440|nr:TrkA family potassium uptake protein [Helicobacter anatolicus]MCE3037553.1 TrkA family potassium uptake protein [Helicobacter anatolicus]MCE3039992.1 TrkA family potassium uptake protein [Helicobacter anatolicus]
MKKNYGVIGLGKFGSYIARGLIDQGESVIICDNSQENFRDFREDVEDLYMLDSTDVLALKEAGISELDVAIVSIGEIEASILTVMALKELGNKTIVAKATNKTHGQILSKIGADHVIYPEREAANRLLTDLLTSKADVSLISENLKVCKVLASDIFGKKTIKDIEEGSVRRDEEDKIIQEIKIIAIKKEDTWILHPEGSDVVENEDFVVFAGNDKSIDFYVNKFEKL